MARVQRHVKILIRPLDESELLLFTHVGPIPSLPPHVNIPCLRAWLSLAFTCWGLWERGYFFDLVFFFRVIYAQRTVFISSEKRTFVFSRNVVKNDRPGNVYGVFYLRLKRELLCYNKFVNFGKFAKEDF